MSGILDFQIEKSDFLTKYSDKRPYLVRSAVASKYVDWEDVSAAIHATTNTQPEIKMHLNGIIPEGDYLENHTAVGTPKRRINPKVFSQLMQVGATLILHRFDERFSQLRKLCVEIASFTNSEALANGYITFSHSGGFGLHWDTHDVMAVQLIGEKRWLVYEPTFLFPLSDNRSSDPHYSPPVEPVMDIILRAGDLLYLPRGWWHNALPIGESFHVAVGIHGPTMLDYINWISGRILRNSIEFRKSARLGLSVSTELADVSEILCRAMTDQSNFSLFLRESAKLMQFNARTQSLPLQDLSRSHKDQLI